MKIVKYTSLPLTCFPIQERFCIILTNLFGEHDAGIAARLDIANMVAKEIWN